ncbi:MAG TPA: exodeoxyribonuclease VII small subunit [Candidatus Coprenecus pullistercoris]|nr:exodeoxyribonuclease VII small subunit [Candidatus Coprenecus pullistercoris]
MENLKYEDALGRLEKIVAEIEDPKTAVGDIPAKVKEAAGLLTYCRKMLKESEESIGRILDEQ